MDGSICTAAVPGNTKYLKETRLKLVGTLLYGLSTRSDTGATWTSFITLTLPGAELPRYV